MSQYRRLCGLGILLFGAMTYCDTAQAQFQIYPPPPAIDYLKPEQIRPDLYPNESEEHSTQNNPVDPESQASPKPEWQPTYSFCKSLYSLFSGDMPYKITAEMYAISRCNEIVDDPYSEFN
jgi:hypothetical protein